MHELLEQLWRADLETAQSIRSGRPAALHDYDEASDDEMSALLRGMHPLAILSGQDFAKRFDFSRCRSILDIGGGSGVRPQPGDERCLVRLAAHRTAGGTENGAAAALAWVLAQGRDIVPLVGARKRGQWAD